MAPLPGQPEAAASSGSLGFLAGGGRMGELIRSHPWARTSLGALETWPQGLRAVVRLMLTTHAPTFIYWGEEAICLYNDASEPTLGAERFLTALGQPGRTVWSEVWDDLRLDIDAVRRGETANLHEARYWQVRDGAALRDSWWTYIQSPIDDPGSPLGIGGVLVISYEVTASIETRHALEAERTRLHSLFESSTTFFATATGPDHRFQFTNEAYRTLVGRDDLEGLTVREALPEIEEQGLLATLDRVYATGEPFVARGLPVRLRRKAGGQDETRWLDFIYHRIDSQPGAPIGIIAEGFDVTPRVLAEQALRTANDALQAILDYCPDLILTIGVDRQIKLVSKSSRDMLGYAPAELHGRHCAQLLGGQDRVEQLMAGVIAGRPLRSHEAATVHKDGSTTTIRWALVWAADLEMVIAIGRDASEVLISEERLRHTQKMEAIGHLTGGVAHDFNNLLTVVIGSLETIVGDLGPDQDLAPIARLALEAAERGADVTSQLLSFARRQAQRPVAVTGSELAACFAPLARTVVRENMYLELSGLNDQWACLSDRGQLQSALLNLCINARDAMGTAGKLTISASTVRVDGADLLQPGDPEPGDFACIEVQDTGTGMTPEVLAHAVEPFFTTKGVQGTGLGLSMVYGFVQQSGGFLRIRSEEGVGSSVALYLPCAPRPTAPAVDQSPKPGQDRVKILVVEDNEPLRLQVTRQLISFGHEVVATEDSRSALRLLSESSDFDLLFTDIAMPGDIDGADLAARAVAIYPSLKVLFTTGYTDRVHGSEDHLGGALLNKPYKTAALQAAVHEALGVA